MEKKVKKLKFVSDRRETQRTQNILGLAGPRMLQPRSLGGSDFQDFY